MGFQDFYPKPIYIYETLIIQKEIPNWYNSFHIKEVIQKHHKTSPWAEIKERVQVITENQYVRFPGFFELKIEEIHSILMFLE